jgi:hypothetical protein
MEFQGLVLQQIRICEAYKLKQGLFHAYVVRLIISMIVNLDKGVMHLVMNIMDELFIQLVKIISSSY